MEPESKFKFAKKIPYYPGSPYCKLRKFISDDSIRKPIMQEDNIVIMNKIDVKNELATEQTPSSDKNMNISEDQKEFKIKTETFKEEPWDEVTFDHLPEENLISNKSLIKSESINPMPQKLEFIFCEIKPNLSETDGEICSVTQDAADLSQKLTNMDGSSEEKSIEETMLISTKPQFVHKRKGLSITKTEMENSFVKDKKNLRNRVTRLTSPKGISSNHILVHTEAEPYSCNFCSFKAKFSSSLKSHLLVHSEERQFSCDLCPFKGKRKSDLNRHILCHNNEKPLSCYLCPYKSKTTDNLNKHMLCHTSGKPFSCDLCPYKSKYSINLKRHLSVHTEERPFSCDLCPYKGKSSVHLRQHVLVHTEEKSVSCKLCSFTAITNRNLKMHMLVHTEERPFSCDLCSYRSKRKNCLTRYLLD